MPAKYHVISGSLWDKPFRALSCAAKVVALNVMTSRNRISEGLFELSAAHIAVDTGLTEDQALDALRELHRANVVRYDADAEMVLDTRALKTFPIRMGVNKKTGEPQPDKRLGSAVDLFLRLPESPLKAEFLALADEHSPVLASAIRQGLGSPSVAPSKGHTDLSEAPSKGRYESEAETEAVTRPSTEAEPEVLTSLQQDENEDPKWAEARRKYLDNGYLPEEIEALIDQAKRYDAEVMAS